MYDNYHNHLLHNSFHHFKHFFHIYNNFRLHKDHDYVNHNIINNDINLDVNHRCRIHGNFSVRRANRRNGLDSQQSTYKQWS